MGSAKPTNATKIFLQMVRAARRGEHMKPRSANDKEYFAQDWFAARLRAAGVDFEQQGRNSYPDFLVHTAPSEGYEVKSLRFDKGKPARKDIDFNSTIPSGKKDGRDVFLAFFLYEGTGKAARSAHTISLAHADLINADHGVADEHLNVAVHEFGSYGDGFIRNRKMYVFPHPVAIDPGGVRRHRLIVPAEWQVSDNKLKKVDTIERVIADRAIDEYTIKLRGRAKAAVRTTPNVDAGKTLVFDVLEAR